MKDTEQRSLLKSLSTDALLHILRSIQQAHIVSVQYLLHAPIKVKIVVRMIRSIDLLYVSLLVY
jgi:hypothetical protein